MLFLRSLGLAGSVYAAVTAPDLFWEYYRMRILRSVKIISTAAVFAIGLGAQNVEVLAQRVSHLEENVRENRESLRVIVREMSEMKLSLNRAIADNNAQLENLSKAIENHNQEFLILARENSQKEIIIYALTVVLGGGLGMGGKWVWDERRGRS